MKYAVRQRPGTFSLLPALQLVTRLLFHLRVRVMIESVYGIHKLLLHAEDYGATSNYDAYGVGTMHLDEC